MVLTYDAYNETLEKQQEKESEVQRMQETYKQDMQKMREEMSQQFTMVMSLIQQNPQLAYIKPEALKVAAQYWNRIPMVSLQHY